MTIRTISRAEYTERLKTPYDPPPEIDEVFEAEYFKLFDRLENTLKNFGKNDPYGEGDYYLAASVARSRGLGFVVTNDEIVTVKFLTEIQETLQESGLNWEITVKSQLFEWGLFVSATQTDLYRRKEDSLSQLRNFEIV